MAEWLPVLNFGLNMLGAILVPIVLGLLAKQGRRRREEAAALAGLTKETRDVAEAAESRLERIENGLVERIIRIETKLDAHLGWHLTPRDRP